jgi:hypothetical protein
MATDQKNPGNKNADALDDEAISNVVVGCLETDDVQTVPEPAERVEGGWWVPLRVFVADDVAEDTEACVAEDTEAWQALDAALLKGTLTKADVVEVLRLHSPPSAGDSYIGDRILAVLAAYTTCDGENLNAALRLAGRDMGAARASVAAVLR